MTSATWCLGEGRDDDHAGLLLHGRGGRPATSAGTMHPSRVKPERVATSRTSSSRSSTCWSSSGVMLAHRLWPGHPHRRPRQGVWPACGPRTGTKTHDAPCRLARGNRRLGLRLSPPGSWPVSSSGARRSKSDGSRDPAGLRSRGLRERVVAARRTPRGRSCGPRGEPARSPSPHGRRRRQGKPGIGSAGRCAAGWH